MATSLRSKSEFPRPGQEPRGADEAGARWQCPRRRYLRVWLGLALACLATVCLIPTAEAAGRVQWKTRTLKEQDESWKIDITLYLSRAPDIAHVPMRFSFQQVTYYELARVDGRDEPILRKVPLHNRQPLVESVDVGFLDPGSGKIEKRTRFSFRVTRAHGFEAGEYDVSITNSRTGRAVGRKQRIIFDGENEVIDRRSMDFSKTEKKEKKEEPKKESDVPHTSQNKLDPDDPAFWEGGPEEEESEEALPPPASVRGKPGGCGCRVVGERQTTPAGSSPIAGSAVLLLLAGCFWRRQRSSASA